MNKQYKKLWLEALRSGKYKQTTGQLGYNGGFCCLGVLCEVTEMPYEHQDTCLPKNIMSAAGLQSDDPQLNYDGKVISLSHLNDDENLTFAQIADLIEEQLWPNKNCNFSKPRSGSLFYYASPRTSSAGQGEYMFRRIIEAIKRWCWPVAGSRYEMRRKLYGQCHDEIKKERGL